MKLLDFTASPVLRFLSRPKPAVAYSDETLAALRGLIKHPDWPLYKLLLDIKVTEAVQGMLAAGEDSQVHYLRGYTQGLLQAALIPEHLVQEQANKESKNARVGAGIKARAAAIKSALYATGHWGSGE